METQMTPELKAQIMKELRDYECDLIETAYDFFGRQSCATSDQLIRRSSIKNFHLFQDLPNAKFSHSYNIGTGTSFIKLFIIDTESEFILRGRSGGSKFEFYDKFCVAGFRTKLNFGRTHIQTEKLSHKVYELFRPLEYDFKQYPRFSRKFYCLSNDTDKLETSLSEELTDHFLSFKNNLYVEFDDKHCLLKTHSSIRKKLINIRLIGFALRLQQLIGYND